MMLTNFTTTLRAGALAALFVVGTSAAAFAAPVVTFYTEGTFGSSGSNTVQFNSPSGTATVTFNGIPSGDPNSHDMSPFGFSNTSYGDFLLSTSGEFIGDANDSFTLDIFQTSPVGGSAQFAGQLTGSFVSVTGQEGTTNFMVTFFPTTTTIDGVTYTVDPMVLLVPPPAGSGGGAASGISSLEGTVSAQPTVVPEPATMMLLGTGLLAAFRARRRLGMENER